MDRQNSGDIKSIIEFLQKKINDIENPKNKGFFYLEEKNVIIDPIKPFDIIIDELWKLFVLNNEKNNYNRKVSLLKGNRKIVIN